MQTKKKRAPTALLISCNVCGAPAPDHLHFGGKEPRGRPPRPSLTVYNEITIINGRVVIVERFVSVYIFAHI